MCIKCEKNHQPGECEIPPITKVDDKSKLYCVTCQKYGHPASYRGCPKQVEFREKLKKKMQNIKENRIIKERMINNYVKKGVSFASVISGDKKQAKQNINQTQTQHNTNTTQNITQNNTYDKAESHDSTNKELKQINHSVNKNAENIEKLFQLMKDFLDINNEG